MRLSIKTKQVAGVVLIVGLAVVVLSAIHLAWIARIHLRESLSRGEMVAQFIFERASRVVTEREQAYAALQADAGLRSLLESSIAYSEHVTYAAIVDPRNVAIVHSSPSLEGQTIEPQPMLTDLLKEGALEQIQAISGDRTFEVQQPLLMQNEQFGSIRVGVSTTLIWTDVLNALRPAAYTALISLIVATLVALLLAQWTLRPVHVLKSGLTRLGRGEFDVKLDLPPGDEFGELGSSFNMLSAELSAVRSKLAAGEAAPFESVVDRLEDAVAMVNPDGQLLFANAAMRASFPTYSTGITLKELPATHPYRTIVEQTLTSRRSHGPLSTGVPIPRGTGQTEQLLSAHLIENAGRFVGVMLVARNLAYLSQVQSTLRYSRKLSSLGRLLAGVAHEVKNPLNAMTIHLELLKQKLGGGLTSSRAAPPKRVAAQTSSQAEGGTGAAVATAATSVGEEGAETERVVVEVPYVMKHVSVIGQEIRRLDEVVQGFLKFSRPEELSLEPVNLGALVADVAEVVEPQAADAGVSINVDCPPDLPFVSGDRSMLRQALLNLALNACQAMPNGGTLRFTARPASDRRVSLSLEDTGIGIAPEHLQRIFDLYFTTREQGSGIGLSMVYRAVQLHDGSIEVQSTPGHGTTFTLMFPQA